MFLSFNAVALWEEGRPTPVDGLWNPYLLDEESFKDFNKKGRLHALNYPVEITGLLLPYEPIKKVADKETNNPLRKFLYRIIGGIGNIKAFDDISQWLGLHRYPKEEGEGPYYIPRKLDLGDERMGFSLIEHGGAKGFTYSCAACHSANLFGKKVMGLTNRFPKANSFFVKGKQALAFVWPWQLGLSAGADKAERSMLRRTKRNLFYVDAKKPIQLGLDTSLAHVAISLSRRAPDEYATKDFHYARKPRREPLRRFVADSKPGVWWNVKYKNRWLLDGSVVSGNPILTNLLWNEIGRGTDLYELEEWIDNNHNVIEELTTAVFGAEAPHMSDFFGPEYFDLKKAKLGQAVFEEARCYKCHGTYIKNWETEDFSGNHWADIYKTKEVRYPEQTLVKNVGTDPNRWQGMASLEQLNDLAISKNNNVKIKLQEGYVPPPLVGIWARWPYFHNNSIPNLCSLFTPPSKRPSSYYAGAAIDKERDFDFSCSGYPLGDAIPNAWKKKDLFYDTSREGLSNSGHYKMFLDDEGNEKFKWQEKLALIHYLQTL